MTWTTKVPPPCITLRWQITMSVWNTWSIRVRLWTHRLAICKRLLCTGPADRAVWVLSTVSSRREPILRSRTAKASTHFIWQCTHLTLCLCCTCCIWISRLMYRTTWVDIRHWCGLLIRDIRSLWIYCSSLEPALQLLTILSWHHSTGQLFEATRCAFARCSSTMPMSMLATRRASLSWTLSTKRSLSEPGTELCWSLMCWQREIQRKRLVLVNTRGQKESHYQRYVERTTCRWDGGLADTRRSALWTQLLI